ADRSSVILIKRRLRPSLKRGTFKTAAQKQGSEGTVVAAGLAHRKKAAVSNGSNVVFFRGRLLGYLGGLILLLSFGSPAGGLFDIPFSFILKNKLNLEVYQ